MMDDWGGPLPQLSGPKTVVLLSLDSDPFRLERSSSGLTSFDPFSSTFEYAYISLYRLLNKSYRLASHYSRMSHNPSGRPTPRYPHSSQDQAQFALDDLFELENAGGRLWWPDTNPASLNKDSNVSADQTRSSPSIEFDFSHESPPKESVPLVKQEKTPVRPAKVAVQTTQAEVHQTHDMTIILGLFTEAATSGPVKNNQKVKWIQHRFPVTKQRINISNTSITQLKAHLYDIADKVRDDKNRGMTALFKTADANKQLSLGVIVYNHPTYGKGKSRVAKDDADLAAFFNVVKSNLGSECAISFSMENPSKAAQAEVDERSLAHAVLKAQNLVNGKGATPDDDLAHSDPVPKRKHCMNELITHQVAIGNKVAEGYRVIKLDEPTKIMRLGFEHMTVWAKILAKGTEGITIDNPPSDIPGFKWESIKRSLVTTVPLLSSKRGKVASNQVSATTWGYAEMQGMHIDVDLEEALRLSNFSTINDYVDFVKVAEQDVDTVVVALEDHRIQSFYDFLFPNAMNARDMERWGIPRGWGHRLMNNPRRYYQYLITKEESKVSMSKAVSPDSEEDQDYEIKVVSSKKK